MKHLILIAIVVLLPACRYHLLEDVVLTDGATPTESSLPEGKPVEGNAYYPYLIGYNLRDSIDEAFENAGEEYDLIVNATVDVKFYYVLLYFSKYVIVTGTAMKSSEIKAALGDEGYDAWLSTQNTLSRASAVD